MKQITSLRVMQQDDTQTIENTPKNDITYVFTSSASVVNV